MKVIFDCTSCQPAFDIETNGGGEYSLRVLEELSKRDEVLKIVLLLNANKGKNKKIDSYSFEKYVYKDINNLSLYLNETDADVIYFPIAYPIYGQIKISNDKKIVCGIHDLSDFYETLFSNYHKRFFNDDGFDWLRSLYSLILKKRKRKISKNMHESIFRLNQHTHIYTVSYYSKHAIEYYLDGCQVEEVFYSPNKLVECNEIDENAVLKKFCVGQYSYFLLTNACRWLKNNEKAIVAFDNLIRKNLIPDDIKIVVLGCNDNFKGHVKKKLTHEQCFVFRGFVDENELECLYKYAKAFVYPSLLEGFGYPPIEAMKYGTVSLCSVSTSIPEITSGNAIYFNPLDLQSIELAILHSFDDEYMARFDRKEIASYYMQLKMKQDDDLGRLIDFILGVRKSE